MGKNYNEIELNDETTVLLLHQELEEEQEHSEDTAEENDK